MVKPLVATLPVLFTIQLVTSRFTTHGDAAFDVDMLSSSEDMVVPDGYTPFPDIGMAYKYFNESLTWESARKHCILDGGNLAVTDSLKKLEYAKSLTPMGDTKSFIVGIHKYFATSEWVSIRTGLPLNHIPWRSDLTRDYRRCAGLITTDDGLRTFTCEAKWSYICEVPIKLKSSEISNNTNVHDVRVSLIFENTSLLIDAIVVPDGYTAFPDVGVAYKYHDQNLTWNSARKYCITEGGSLAVIDSFKKKEYAKSKVSSGGPGGPFVGFHKLFDHSEWVSVRTGLPVEFVPWVEGSNLKDTTRSCASLWTTGISPISCSARGAHICEIQLIPHNVNTN